MVSDGFTQSSLATEWMCSNSGRFSQLTRPTQNLQGSLLELFTCAHVQPWRRRLRGLMCAAIRKGGADRSSMKGWSLTVKGALDYRSPNANRRIQKIV